MAVSAFCTLPLAVLLTNYLFLLRAYLIRSLPVLAIDLVVGLNLVFDRISYCHGIAVWLIGKPIK